MAKASTPAWYNHAKCHWWMWRCENVVVMAKVRDRVSELGKPTGNTGRVALIDPSKTQYFREGIVLHKTVECNWAALWAFIKRNFVRALVPC